MKTILPCNHKELMVRRAHKESELGEESESLAIIVDKSDCLVFVQCCKCGKIMKIKRDTFFDNVSPVTKVYKEYFKKLKDMDLGGMSYADKQTVSEEIERVQAHLRKLDGV